MKEKLLEAGWKMVHECVQPCGHKQYFTKADKPGYEIRVRVKKSTFTILKTNITIAGPYRDYELITRIAEFVK